MKESVLYKLSIFTLSLCAVVAALGFGFGGSSPTSSPARVRGGHEAPPETNWYDIYSNELQAIYYMQDDNGSTQVVDSTTNELHGTPVGGPELGVSVGTNVNNREEFAIGFDGTNDFISLPTNAFPQITGTLMFWMKSNTNFIPASNAGVFQFADGTVVTAAVNNEATCKILDVNEKIQLIYSTDGGDISTLISIDPLVDLQWYHIAWTYDDTNDSHLYVDSVLNATVEPSAPLSLFNVTNSYIGRAYTDGDHKTNYFNGWMDGFRMYDFAMTSNQISTIYWRTLMPDGNIEVRIAAPVPVDPDLLMWHQFSADFDGSDTVYDTTTNDNDGIQTNSSFQPVWTNDVGDGGFFIFDGSDDWIIIADAASLDTAANFSISGWIKMDDAGRNIWCTKSPSGNASDGGWEWDYGAYTGGQSEFGVFDEEADYIIAGAALTTGVWHFVVATVDLGRTGDDKVRLYHDGVEQTETYTSSGAFGTPAVNAIQVNIGGRTVDDFKFYDGSIDDVRIYGVALSSNEQYTIYTNTAGNY